MFDGMELALKPRGHLLITDYIAEADAMGTKAVQTWCDKEPLTPKKLTELPPATAFMAVYRHIGGCEAPLTMARYRNPNGR